MKELIDKIEAHPTMEEYKKEENNRV